MPMKAPHAGPAPGDVCEHWLHSAPLSGQRFFSPPSWRLKGGEINWEWAYYSGFHVQVPVWVSTGSKLFKPAFPRQQSVSAHVQLLLSWLTLLPMGLKEVQFHIWDPARSCIWKKKKTKNTKEKAPYLQVEKDEGQKQACFRQWYTNNRGYT